jgi:anti-anti-sigma factor
MTAAHTNTARTPHHGGLAAIDCRGAWLTVHAHAGVIVIAIGGEIDASNIDELSRHARALVPESAKLIVDLTAIDFIAVEGLRALFALNSHCAGTGTAWALITSRAVRRLLRVGDHDEVLPAVGSATAALLFVRGVQLRRPVAPAHQPGKLAGPPDDHFVLTSRNRGPTTRV